MLIVLPFLLSLISQHANGKAKYSEILTSIENGDVKEISTNPDSSEIEIIFEDGTKKTAYIPSVDEFWKYVNDQRKLGNNFEVSVKTNYTAFISKVFSTAIDIASIVIFIFFANAMIKSTGAGAFEINNVTTNVRFSDVAGIDEEREQLSEVVDFLKHPKRYKDVGARIPKGVLLEGAPGTGKTLLAKAIAGEAGVPFFQVTGSSFDEMFIGVGASRIRKIFNEAKKVAPSIIFIDEIDGVATNRNNLISSHNEERKTLNQLLAEMDGFNSNTNVVVIAATNHKELLDPAILRPGRFDRHVFVPMPNVKAREEILKVHARNKYFSPHVTFQEIAKKTAGFSGANLENLLNEAALLTVKLGIPYITNEIIDEAIARVIIGIKKESLPLSEGEKRLTAVHEAGHAIVSAIIRPDVKNFCISIVRRGEAGGYNFFDEPNEIYSQKQEIIKEICVLYGGRCAEQIIIGDISNGASNDLERATNLAYNMVMKFAMTESKLVKVIDHPKFNEHIEEQSIEKIEKICSDAYQRTLEIITENKQIVSKLAALIVEKEYLSDIEISAFLSENLLLSNKK